jgi:organic radical activating enzyme
MFGKNPIAKDERALDGKNLDVKEIFYTIQGEGPYTGWPAVFVRLAKCHLACTFCDTDFENGESWKVQDIVNQILQLQPSVRLVVLTGGEPARQNLAPLIECMKRDLPHDCRIQMETAGSFWQDCFKQIEVVVSPKTSFVRPEIREHAIAFKYVIDAAMDFTSEGVPICDTQGRGNMRPLALPEEDVPVYISPMDEQDKLANRMNRDRAVELCMLHGFILNLQVHKIIELP